MARRRPVRSPSTASWFAVILVLALLAAGCGAQAPGVTPSSAPPDPGTAVTRYVALGDSYTIGTAVATEERWPDQLVSRLTAAPAALGRLELVANHAVNGFTSADVIERELPLLDADEDVGFVSLLVGVNDVVRGVPAETYGANVEVILAALLDRLPPARILCVETPDYTVTPQGAAFGDPDRQRAGIERVNAILRERCERAGIPYVDGIFAISADAASDLTLVASDGLHPSGAQYRRWVVERIEPVVRGMLAAP